MSTERLSDGTHIFPMPGNLWVLFGPDDNWMRLHAEPDRLALLAQGLRDSGRGLAVDFLALGVADLVAELAAAGLLTNSPATTTTQQPSPSRQAPMATQTRAPPLPRIGQTATEVWLHGEGPFAACLANRLDGLGLSVQPWRDVTAVPALLRHGDVLVDISPWQPAARWSALDAHCREHGLAWYGCHHEGRRLFAGPPWVPEGSVCYADLLARREACADHPLELRAYLDYLDTHHNLPAPPAASAAALAQLSEAICADLARYANHEHNHDGVVWQHSIDVDGGDMRRHPMLPIPRNLAT